MLKTTAQRGKNNKYGSSFPHTHISTLDRSMALTENTNRCRVTCHSHRKAKSSAQLARLHPNTSVLKGRKAWKEKEGHPSTCPLISIIKTVDGQNNR